MTVHADDSVSSPNLKKEPFTFKDQYMLGQKIRSHNKSSNSYTEGKKARAVFVILYRSLPCFISKNLES